MHTNKPVCFQIRVHPCPSVAKPLGDPTQESSNSESILIAIVFWNQTTRRLESRWRDLKNLGELQNCFSGAGEGFRAQRAHAAPNGREGPGYTLQARGAPGR